MGGVSACGTNTAPETQTDLDRIIERFHGRGVRLQEVRHRLGNIVGKLVGTATNEVATATGDPKPANTISELERLDSLYGETLAGIDDLLQTLEITI